jgi:Iron-sulfur cluster-binding domain
MLAVSPLSDQSDYGVDALDAARAEMARAEIRLLDGGVRPLDEDIIAKIREIGFHPFLMVRLGSEGTQERRFLVCKTENEVPQFVEELAAIPQLAECKLLHGLERALQLETYEAAEAWFSWMRETPTGPTEIVRLGLSAGTELTCYYGYPSFDVVPNETGDSAERRLEALIRLFDAYLATDGNNATRVRLVEALALALSRCLGARGDYHEALWIVDRALPLWPSSIHLKAARHALGLKVDGKMVPDRLVKFIGEDNGYLKQFVCPLPFEHFEISPSGDVLVCCGHWLPTSIGNFLKDPIDGILNSAKAQKIRESMTDGSYKYCNHLDCGTMIQGTLPTVDELERPRTRQAAAERNYRMEGVDYLTFGFDQTCNLSCPSCRTHRIVEKTSASIEKARAVEEKLVDLLPTVRVLHINPAGEMLSSKPSRKLLELIDDERCPDLVLDVISNGTLFNEEEWNKFPGIHNKIRSVRISIDAARKETFEKLRRLGRYEPFVENMRFLSRLRAAGIIPQLKFSFTYQLDNFREMPEFVDFCASMNADFAIFERLQNIAFSATEFRAKAVHYPDHPLYAEFLEVVANPIFASPRVWHDFDYVGAAKMTSDEARKRLVETTAALSGTTAAAHA